MSDTCIMEPPVFSYPETTKRAENKRQEFSGNVSIELFFDFSTLIPNAIFKNLLIPELSDKELIEAAEKTGTFEFWNNARDDAYNKLL